MLPLLPDYAFNIIWKIVLKLLLINFKESVEKHFGKLNFKIGDNKNEYRKTIQSRGKRI